MLKRFKSLLLKSEGDHEKHEIVITAEVKSAYLLGCAIKDALKKYSEVTGDVVRVEIVAEVEEIK